jgi:hypothetical protein
MAPVFSQIIDREDLDTFSSPYGREEGSDRPGRDPVAAEF